MGMSANSQAISALDVAARKGGEPLVCLTACTTPMARIVDAHCDLALVSDSLGMVLHGLPSTLGVTMEMMVLHGKAVRRGLERALLVVDMPFGSYEESPAQAFRNAAGMMAETNCGAVKLEGGEAMEATIAHLTARGIPVMAHIGLPPPFGARVWGLKGAGPRRRRGPCGGRRGRRQPRGRLRAVAA